MDVDSRRWHDRFLTYGVRRTGAGGRYENATGQTWETKNPWWRGGDLDIRRLRLVGRREWRETRRASKVTRTVEDALEADLMAMYGYIREAEDRRAGEGEANADGERGGRG